LVILIPLFASLNCGSEPEKIILASVGDSTITADMVNSIFDKNPRNRNLPSDKEYEVKKVILENLASKQLLASGAIDSNLHLRSEFSSRLENDRRLIVSTLYFDDNITAQSQPSPEEIENFKSESRFQVNLALIRLSAPFDTALSIYERLLNGEDLAKLSLNYSDDIFSRNNGGLTGLRPITLYPSRVRAAIDTLTEMVYTTPFFDNDSYWIIKVLEGKTVENSGEEYNDQKIAAVARDFKKLYRTISISEQLWNKFDTNIDKSMINLFEDRIRERGKPLNSIRGFENEYFSEEEKGRSFAKYDGGDFLLSQFLDGFNDFGPALYPASGNWESYKRFINRCLFDEFLYLQAESENYSSDPRYLLQWRLTYMKMLADFAIGAITSKIKITEDDVKSEYQNNPQKYMEPGQAQVDEIKLASRQDSEMILKKLSEGASFDKLAKEFSVRSYSGKRGADLGWVNTQRYPEYYAKARHARPGDILGPIQIQDGFGIIRLKQKRDSAPKTFTSIQHIIKADLLATAREKAQEIYINELKNKYEMKINYDLLKTTINSKRIS